MNKRLIWLIPALVLLFFCFVGYQNAASGQWHSDIEGFWQKQQWHEIRALADNLDRTNRSDSETLYLAARATYNSSESCISRPFLIKVFGETCVELGCRSLAASKLQTAETPGTCPPFSYARHYRNSGTHHTLNLLVLWKGWNLLPWTAILSVLGIAVALI